MIFHQQIVSNEQPYFLSLKKELNQTIDKMNQIYTNLEQVTDPELIDCAIYDLKSNQMRYAYLHKILSTHFSENE